jgi:hypothetical protein
MTASDLARAHAARWRAMRKLAADYARALPNNPDWELVLLFYAALHLVQAYFGTKNHRFEAARHHDRIKAIKESPELMKNRAFLTAYRMLQDASEQVRYEPSFQVDASLIRLAHQNLSVIESWLEQKVAKALN